MSLLDRGPHTVVITPKRKQRNQYGEWELTPGRPVTVRGVMVQPVEAAEAAALGGTKVETFYRIIGRGPWPGGPHSEVTWNGRTWDQIGEPRDYSVSRRTAHFETRIQARSAEVK